jgi:hypothetical protein
MPPAAEAPAGGVFDIIVEAARHSGMTAVQVPWDDPAPAIDIARDLLGLPLRGQ